jgi:hypothetical protein
VEQARPPVAGGANNPPVILIREEQPVTEDDFQIMQNARGGITITGYTGNARQVVIPETIYGLRVTEIAAGAFHNKNLTAITIPNGVITIGTSAFSSNDFQNLVIPDSVTNVGIHAFANSGIQNLSLGNGLQTIDAAAFSSNAIENLIIPDSVTEIRGFEHPTGAGWGAFENNGIKTLKLGSRLTHIGRRAFANNMISEILFPPSLRIIHHSAFSNNQLSALVFPDGINFLAGSVVSSYEPFEGNPITSITIPPSLASYEEAYAGFGAYFRISGFEDSFRSLSITRITLPAHVDERNLRQFGEGFVNFWNLWSRRAGTYVFTGRIWTIE